MPPDRAQRVAEIVEGALDCETRECSSYIAEECGPDAELRAEVESLLGFRAEAQRFIEQPAFELNAELLLDDAGELQPGDRVSDYEIESLLGEGGMGEVYLARDLSLGRGVALKTVKRGFRAGDLLRHFRQEERILAGLTHPNIAQLYGTAVTSDGTPCFVMEYVPGERLDVYCEERQLSIADRLQLFRKVCAAVAYAHQHLVIHRDLKPANIRVTAEGEPKLLDFGIAKLLDTATETAPQQTMTLLGVMTPEYASPEQVRGETMTTASDVYSLGVVLYELLAGRKPYRLTTHNPADVSRAVLEQELQRPSTAAPNDSRSSNTDSRRSLRGDLDNIVLMAMRKEPERRYASVALLAEDIRRHLDGLPVLARRDTWRYRSGKFVRRHKAGMIAATIVAFALIAGIIATSWEARIARLERARAEQRFNDVRKLANSYLFEFHDAIENLPGSTAARALLVKRALEYLDSLAREAGNDLSLQRELVMAYIKVGNVQGNPQNANLGDSAGALESYGKARAFAERWPASLEVPARRPLALIDEKTGDVLAGMNRIEEAVASARRALQIFEEVAQHVAPADEASAKLSVAISRLKLGDLVGNPNFVNAGDPDAAMRTYQAALNTLEELHAADPANPKVRRFLGVIHERIGAVLEGQDQIPAARAAYERSAAIRVPLANEFPNDTSMVRDGAIAYEKLGTALAASGDLNAALPNRQKSLQIFADLLRADPQNAHAQQSLAISYIHLADLLGGADGPNLGQPDAAIENYDHAAALLEAITRTDPKNAAAERELDEARTKRMRVAAAATK